MKHDLVERRECLRSPRFNLDPAACVEYRSPYSPSDTVKLQLAVALPLQAGAYKDLNTLLSNSSLQCFDSEMLQPRVPATGVGRLARAWLLSLFHHLAPGSSSSLSRVALGVSKSQCAWGMQRPQHLQRSSHLLTGIVVGPAQLMTSRVLHAAQACYVIIVVHFLCRGKRFKLHNPVFAVIRPPPS